jgi:60 kDa SS-A/Ro ribonucleoprotein
MTRMNLNTFARHGVFAVPGAAGEIAARLRDPAAIERARVFPYQVLAAWGSTGSDVPAEVREALQDALEVSLRSVPSIDGRVFVCPDVSGSMRSPVTGARGAATSKVRCVDVAALVAAALARKNPEAEVIPFEHEVVDLRLNPRDSVLTNAARLAAVGGGGTSVSAPLALLNRRGERGDLVVYVSDTESWVDAGRGRGTATLAEWNAFRARSPAAKLVLIDLQPNATTQAADREDILNVGGFSDAVFEVIAAFAAGRLAAGHWVGAIESVEI